MPNEIVFRKIDASLEVRADALVYGFLGIGLAEFIEQAIENKDGKYDCLFCKEE